ncbi:hypothetical protein E5D57_009232 [Metarhizium anisopliae]|nr:hypothetical protein E5D57_009232 [Metarhizium anisopliae]
MEAADLVEELCIHQLNRAGIQNKAIFRDDHTARQRLKTWQATTFRTDDGRAYAGRLWIFSTEIKPMRKDFLKVFREICRIYGERIPS